MLPTTEDAPPAHARAGGRIGDCAGTCGQTGIRLHAKGMCKRCYDVFMRPIGSKWRKVDLDPCPICGVRSAQHWKCASCSGRGHLSPPDAAQPTRCESCVRADIARVRADAQDALEAACERERLAAMYRARNPHWRGWKG